MVLRGARIFHVNVNCTDLDASRRFYTEGLGFADGVRTAPPTAQPGGAFGLERAWWDAWILLGRRGWDGGALDLLEWREPPPTGAAPSSVTECGFQRLGVLVPDLDAAIAAATGAGGSVWSEPFAHALPGGGEIRLVLADDPDGVAVELIERGGPRLSFVAVTCADLARSCAWYQALGFLEVSRHPSAHPAAAHLRLDGPVAMEEVVLAPPGGGEVLVMLVGVETPPARPVPVRPANAIGIWRAAMLVDDLGAATAALARLGVPTMSAPVALAMGPGLPELRFVCFAGPDGEVLELIEQPAPAEAVTGSVS